MHLKKTHTLDNNNIYTECIIVYDLFLLCLKVFLWYINNLFNLLKKCIFKILILKLNFFRFKCVLSLRALFIFIKNVL